MLGANVKRALYLAIIVAVIACAFAGGFVLGRRSKPAAQSEAGDLVLPLYQAATLIMEGNLVKARELYKKVLARDPKSVGALVGLGSTYGLQSDYTNAAAAFEKALSLDDQNAAAHWALAKAQIYLGEKERARAHLERFKQLDPTSSRIADLENMLGPSPQPDASPNAAPPHR